MAYVQNMRAGKTLFVAWQHWFLSFLVTELGFEGLVPTSFPRSCNYTQWTEPAYAMDPEEGDCNDVIWQVVLFRERPTQAWRTDSFSQLHQGFGGRQDSPCASAFYPHSTPTLWNLTVGEMRLVDSSGRAHKFPADTLVAAAAARPGSTMMWLVGVASLAVGVAVGTSVRRVHDMRGAWSRAAGRCEASTEDAATENVPRAVGRAAHWLASWNRGSSDVEHSTEYRAA